MKRAAKSAVFQSPISEVGAAMRAMAANQPIPALGVLEGDEVLSHEPDGFYGPVAGKLIDECRRLPVVAHQIASGRAARGTGDEIVLFRAQHQWTLFSHSDRGRSYYTIIANCPEATP